MEGGSRNLLQHPRRNLGNRYRSQARKFIKLASTDGTRFADNISWAEQSARQAILYDFTEEENWRCLAEIKVILGDAEGLRVNRPVHSRHVGLVRQRNQRAVDWVVLSILVAIRVSANALAWLAARKLILIASSLAVPAVWVAVVWPHVLWVERIWHGGARDSRVVSGLR